MTQPKRKKDERAELVKLFRTVLPGDFVKVLENGIQSIIEAELSSILGAEPYQRVEAGLTTAMATVSVKSLSAPDWGP